LWNNPAAGIGADMRGSGVAIYAAAGGGDQSKPHAPLCGYATPQAEYERIARRRLLHHPRKNCVCAC